MIAETMKWAGETERGEIDDSVGDGFVDQEEVDVER